MTGNETATIKDQTKLPLEVAVGVVMQGIRIRFGRSVVTILGVGFGTAFLMSMLTSQLIREGVSEEVALRTEVRRMANFLRADTGPVRDNAWGVVACGPLNETERRLLQRLAGQGVRQFRWASATGETPPVSLSAEIVVRTPLEEVAHGVQAVLVVGDGKPPAALWRPVAAGARRTIMAFTRRGVAAADVRRASVVALDRKPGSEEIERALREEKRQRARSISIVIISLLVTLIGISNAMLMSVTERFREIGTMKCLGARSAFIRRIFLIESGSMGLVGGILGVVAGTLFSVTMYSAVYGLAMVLGSLNGGLLLVYMAALTLAAILLSMLAAVYPATVAAGMVPSDALRTNI